LSRHEIAEKLLTWR